jgi:hypothetical protein
MTACKYDNLLPFSSFAKIFLQMAAILLLWCHLEIVQLIFAKFAKNLVFLIAVKVFFAS